MVEEPPETEVYRFGGRDHVYDPTRRDLTI